MDIYGLIGWPLGHSFSRQFFQEKFSQEGIDAEYRNFEMETVSTLPALLQQEPRLRGLNVTIPHKRVVISLLDALTPAAREIGAVNVIRISRKVGEVRLVGYNSDVVGFRDSLRPLLQPWHKRALVLGTGGASLAVVHALRELGIQPTYVSRTPEKQTDNMTSAGVVPSSGSQRMGSVADMIPRLAYADLTPEVMAEHLVVVNCTPVGMYPHVDEAPAIPYAQLSPRHLLYDLVYNPTETLFLRRGIERGCIVKNGLEMLRLQALEAWRVWQGEP